MGQEPASSADGRVPGVRVRSPQNNGKEDASTMAPWHSQHLAAPAAGTDHTPVHRGCQGQQPFLVLRGHKNDKVSLCSCKSEWLQLQISNSPLHFKLKQITAWKGFSPRWRIDKSRGTNLRVKGTNSNQPDGWPPYNLGIWGAVSNGWVANHGTQTLLCPRHCCASSQHHLHICPKGIVTSPLLAALPWGQHTNEHKALSCCQTHPGLYLFIYY